MKLLILQQAEQRTLREMGVFHLHPRVRMRAQAIVRIRRFSLVGRRLDRRLELNRCRMTSASMFSVHCATITSCAGERNAGRRCATTRSVSSTIWRRKTHTLHITLSATQEAILLSLRQSLYLPLYDLLYITRRYISPDVSRSGIAHLLKREGMARLENVIPSAEGETILAKKTFKDYEPGFVHVDIKYLLQMPDETSRRYRFVAIDRATRWVFLQIYGDMSDQSSVDFLSRLKLISPIKNIKLLTGNGSQFTDRFTTKDMKSSGQHAFDKVCVSMGIEYRLAPPRHPQTNGMVEHSTAVSKSYCSRPDSTAGLIWKRPC